MATLASLGFAEMHIGDTAAGRQSVITTSTSLATQRQDRIEAARLAATAATRAREAECTKRGPMCRDREADERAALAALNSAVAAHVPVAAPIAGTDPQVTAALRLATWVGLRLGADDVINLRLALMALLPNVAGLLLAFAAGLGAARSTLANSTRDPHTAAALRELAAEHEAAAENGAAGDQSNPTPEQD